ncbi:MAG: heme-binding protein [Blastocatellia bacterium]|nr:heme-binding protein [Blastocatellia bacterium]
MFARVLPNARITLTAVMIMIALSAVVAVRLARPAGAVAAGVTSVNAASFLGTLAPNTIAAAFGTNLAAQTRVAETLPLPTQLGGTEVRIVDAGGASHRAPLFFVSPGQVNYLVPEGIALGNAQVTIVSGSGASSTGGLRIERSSPALFTTAYNGRGLPVALTTFDGTNFDPVVNPDGTPRAVSCGTMWRPNYLLLFGTGFRGGANLRVRVGGVEATPLYVGAQGNFAGLDQINVMIPPGAQGGVTEISILNDSGASNPVQLLMQSAAAPTQAALTVADVQTIIAQAVAKAQQIGMNVTVGVTDKEGNVLGVFRMNGAPATTRIGAFNLLNRQRLKPTDPDGLQDTDVPANFAVISKAGTASFFSTQGSAISTRTASFIIQENFPPGNLGQPGGPLFGVQFSQLPCSDIKIPNLPLGLSGDPGGVPIYKNGVAAGGVGIEGDGLYSIDVNTVDQDQAPEELIAVAATRGFDTPPQIRIDTVQVDGITLPFVNVPQTGTTAPPFAGLPGTVDPAFPIRPTQASLFSPLTLGGVPGRVDPRFFPFKSSALPGANQLTAADVNRIITQAAQQAYRTRAAIRQPIGSPAEVNITVVDASGAVLGIFSTQDAPIFGFDVSAQKARTAAFFSGANASAQIRAAEGGRFAPFADAALSDGIRLDGSVAFSNRAAGFLSRPFFPDGIRGTVNGPFSKPINLWSPFNTGLQLALVKTALVNILSGNPAPSCTAIPGLQNGIQIFAGSVPLYKNGVLVGAVGISGDGIDQDDIIAATGSVGYEAPANIRADQLTPRGVRLPYVKFPRHPNLP